MNQLNGTWKLATVIYMKHVFRAFRITSYISLSIYAISMLIVKCLGYPIDILLNPEYRLWVLLGLMVFHFFPVNIYVLKRTLNGHSQGYTLVALPQNEEEEVNA